MEDRETWVFALDLDALARVVGTSRSRLVARLFPEQRESALDERGRSASDAEEAEEETAGPWEGVAVITAARRRKKSSSHFEKTPKELLAVGGESVIVHSLRSLERAKFANVVVVVGYRGAEITAHIERGFRPKGQMRVEVLSLGEDWSGTHAQSVLRAKPTLDRLCGGGGGESCPALVVTSDHLFDPSLLDAMIHHVEGDALLVEGQLHDNLRDYLLPPTAVRVRTTLVDAEFWCERVGRKVEDHDAFDAGLVRLATPLVWEALAKLEKRGKYFALCDALDVAAKKGRLRAVFTEGRPWVAIETEEQYEATRVLLASPSFSAQIPIEVHYKFGSRPSLTNLEAGTEEGGESQTYAVVSADGFEAEKEIVDANDSSFLVRDGDQLVAVVPREEAARCALDSLDPSLPLSLTGLRDASDIERVGIAQPKGADCALDVVVERKVPTVGWVVLVAATALQSSSALVFSSPDPDPPRLILTLWRPLAAALGVAPLVVLRRFVSGEDHRPPGASPRPLAVVVAVCAFWISNSAYQLAFAFASPGTIIILVSLTPLMVLFARALGVYGAKPTTREACGTAVGLAGCVACTLASPAAPALPAADLPLAVLLGLCSLGTNTIYTLSAKTLRAHFAGPDLHFLLQLGSVALNVALLAPADPRLFSTDSDRGILGLFGQTRWKKYAYLGLVVDTGGTMGFVVALFYHDPLLVAMALLFEPLCAALEASAWNRDPLPSPAYFAGAAVLATGVVLICRDEAHTTRVLNADAALSVPGKHNRRPLVSLTSALAKGRNKIMAVFKRRQPTEERTGLLRTNQARFTHL